MCDTGVGVGEEEGGCRHVFWCRYYSTVVGRESERYNETGASFMDSELLTHTLPRNRVHVTASLEHGQKVCSLHQ